MASGVATAACIRRALPRKPARGGRPAAVWGEVGGTGEFYDASQLELGMRQTRPTTDKGNRIDYVFVANTRTPWATEDVTMSYEDSPAGHHLLMTDAVLLRTGS